MYVQDEVLVGLLQGPTQVLDVWTMAIVPCQNSGGTEWSIVQYDCNPVAGSQAAARTFKGSDIGQIIYGQNVGSEHVGPG